MSLILSGSDGVSDIDGTVSTPAIRGTDSNTGIFFPAADTIAFSEGGAEAMRIDSSGNVGIGTASPRVKLDISGSVLVNGYQTSSNYAPLGVKTTSTVSTPSTFTNAINIWNGTNVGEYSNITFGYNTLGLTNAAAYMGFISTSSSNNGRGALVFGTRDVDTDTAATERMRITSAGNVLIGTTSTGPVNANAITLEPTNSYMRVAHSGTGNGTAYIQFDYNGSSIGSVTQATTSTVAFNTSSDYRLKENIAPMTGALAKVAQLKPCTYNWKVDGANGQGFIAHELQAVVPECVTGEKDAVNADGTIKPQQMDTSFLVATLTAAIQEQQALIENLTTRLNALEGN